MGNYEFRAFSVTDSRALSKKKPLRLSDVIAFPRPFNNSGPQQPLQDYTQTVAHLAALGLTPDMLMNFRAIHDKDKSVAAIKRYGTLNQHWAELCEWNNRDYGVFLTVSQMDGVGDKIPNVTAIRACYLDLDSLDAVANRDRAQWHMPMPSFYVQSSPNKAHVYWPLDQLYAPGDWFGETQAKLAQKYEGDWRIVDPTRVMRLAGFLHNKGVPVLSTFHRLPGYGMPTQGRALIDSLADINVIHHGGGQRHPLGTPDLAAPSLAWVDYAFAHFDPNSMTRDEWIAFTAAIKQAMWSHTSPDDAFARWSTWCARYAQNDPAENVKQWNDITETQVGWKTVTHKSINIRAMLQTGTVPRPALTQPVHAPIKDTFLTQFTEGTNCKPVSSEAFRLLRELNLPIGFNEFKQEIAVTGKLPWDTMQYLTYPRDWTDTDDVSLHALIQQSIGMARISEGAVRNALKMYVDRKHFNPIVDYLSALKWDGIPRLSECLNRYFDAENAEFARLISQKFFIGMVTRAMNPGCKRDEMLILEGEQGARKSTALNIIAGGDEYFLDSLPNMHDKEAMMLMHGNWLIEVGELEGMRKSEVTAIKQFTASKNDKYRPPYGRTVQSIPRTSVFAATTNADTYLTDPTGARRFWPIRCGKIDVDGLRRDRDQLFAEAVARFNGGERWWLEGDAEIALARAQADLRDAQDAWHEAVAGYAARCTAANMPISMNEVFQLVLQVPYNAQDRKKTGRVAAILTKEGFKRVQIPRGGPWFYVKKDKNPSEFPS